MTHAIEFCFDLSSPWTYLAFHNIRPLAARHSAEIRWTPILVGGVFNAVNPSVYAAREAMDSPKFRHMGKVMRDWAKLADVDLKFPAPWHPLKSVNAMRACCALEDDQAALERFAEAAFHAYFVEQRNLDDATEIAAVADAIGMDGEALVAAANCQPVKDRLRANTERLVARGGYGSPSIFVRGTDMYFGNDQLPLVEQALKRNGEAVS
ncbi:MULTISPECIES: 2-hydroxychromene-2-carboxylate isomerase [Pseudomonadota]|jgi:2-hydroxychromene-2-carboxylate isomerase|uniref:2-hydroxychromene-2-carboxylate isomerase n=1 Tax=Pseudomonadota TaxID=1224 RepID=UPI00076A6173|nr:MULTISPECIES: 2-hydroxychromene-2-carboxylate isomerase [Pseudomonadota]MAF63464.1 2-hydroxychromene-2-carboxylate isomerase [Blastomonas sp.]|tara:strand:+ start:18629 stop:19255 length:627 start_codon:yes stop_codon:yes gene_type:complete